MDKVNLGQKFATFTDYFNQRIVGELNGQHVKLVKVKGDFPWHHHDVEDELFLVVKGRFRMELRDRDVWVEEGEFLIVPHGVEHRQPRSQREDPARSRTDLRTGPRALRRASNNSLIQSATGALCQAVISSGVGWSKNSAIFLESNGKATDFPQPPHYFSCRLRSRTSSEVRP